MSTTSPAESHLDAPNCDDSRADEDPNAEEDFAWYATSELIDELASRNGDVS